MFITILTNIYKEKESQFSKFSVLCIFKLYFIGYAVTVVLIFPALAPSTQHTQSLRQSPHHDSCPWILGISSLATPFPTWYFTPPWLFCNLLFVLLNPLTSSPIPPTPPFHLATIKTLSVSMILFLFFSFA